MKNEKKPKYERWHKLYNDKAETKESVANPYFDCRDGVVKQIEYNDESGYGMRTQLLLCSDNKHETNALIRRVYSNGSWQEEAMYFDSDSFEYLEALIKGENKPYGGQIELLRTY